MHISDLAAPFGLENGGLLRNLSRVSRVCNTVNIVRAVIGSAFKDNIRLNYVLRFGFLDRNLLVDD